MYKYKAKKLYDRFYKHNIFKIVTQWLSRTKETKEIDWSATSQATDYIVYYGKPLIAISHTSLGLNSNPRQ